MPNSKNNNSDDQGITKEMSGVLTWIAGHDATCKERYEAILRGLLDCQKAITDSKIENKENLAALEQEMRESNAMQDEKVKANQDAITAINLKIAYALGAGFAGSLIGGALLQLLSGVLAK